MKLVLAAIGLVIGVVFLFPGFSTVKEIQSQGLDGSQSLFGEWTVGLLISACGAWLIVQSLTSIVGVLFAPPQAKPRLLETDTEPTAPAVTTGRATGVLMRTRRGLFIVGINPPAGKKAKVARLAGIDLTLFDASQTRQLLEAQAAELKKDEEVNEDEYVFGIFSLKTSNAEAVVVGARNLRLATKAEIEAAKDTIRR